MSETHHEWEAKGLTVSIPTAKAQQSLKEISQKIEDDFLSAMMGSSDGVQVTIRGIGNINPDPFGPPSGPSFERIMLSYAEARELAEWILEHLD